MIRHLLIALFLLSYSFQGTAQEKPALDWKSVSKWQSIRPYTQTLSPDGKWLAWSAGPTEGDLWLTLRYTEDTTKYQFPIGAKSTEAHFSADGQFMAFLVSPKEAEAKAAKKSNKTLSNKLTLVKLSDTSKRNFDKVKSLSFSGDSPAWLLIQFDAAEGSPKGKDAPKGSDAILYELATQKSFPLGSVSEFAFNKAGDQLAYCIDAAGRNGNGIYLRNLASGTTTALDNDTAAYKSINWNEEGTAFALLKASKSPLYKEELHTVLGVSLLPKGQTKLVQYQGIADSSITKGMAISSHMKPFWSDDLRQLFFGINKIEAVEKSKAKKDTTNQDSSKQQELAAKAKPTSKKDDIEKPDMIIWNWQDKRLQSAQKTQEMRDKNFSYLSSYSVDDKRFTQWADSNVRNVTIAPKQLFAIGYDDAAYELMSNLDGQRFADVYIYNLQTGNRKLQFEHFPMIGRIIPSPDGKKTTFYRDSNYYALDLGSGEIIPLTKSIPSLFVNILDDHNLPHYPTTNFGWSSDSKYVFIADNNDLYLIPADGKKYEKLTANFGGTKQTVQQRYSLYENEKGIDLSKDQYFNVFNSRDKRDGIALLPAGKRSLQLLFEDDNLYGNLEKAKNAQTFIFSKQNAVQAPDFFASKEKTLAAANQLSHNTPDQDKYAWSAGVKLIDYVSANGDSLQAAIYLPADYQEGKSYPTITYIYERLTDGLNGYAMPDFSRTGFNRSLYTSNGYAVLMPDIAYKLNDPGMSAVACVVPAVEAAVATGIVDKDNVAIHGHSWGGYQTSFLITQTNIFKAAAAGAPLTNMISMYSLIYWNSGGTNQAIFEASQGRLTPGYWDNWEAFTRNSPIYYIKNVQTPLLLLHNDKDGAVDFTQGIEYYNGLRRLKKPVVMITYNGENHGLAQLPNRKDYSVRMMEYFDHFLKGKPAPDWWTKGIDRLDMEKHLEERAF
ncbi:S9 family peptidase [Olivibacter sitiensis]|uniref:S9 family peptidase n=1 Tax=Olivibacter sitiensis TaxID=376470 RepID=UPI00040BB231|nr:prolyl oligopeptidase family serine peptidase [Olivibacter sitiensis]